MVSNIDESKWIIPSTVRNEGYNSNGWKYGNASSYSHMYYINILNKPISVEFQVNEIYSNGLVVAVYDSNKSNPQYIQYNTINNLWNGNITNITQSLSTGSRIRVEFDTNELRAYVNNNLLTSGTITLPSTFYLGLQTGSNRHIRIKDFKIKLL